MTRFIIAAASVLALGAVTLASGANAEPTKIRIGWNQAPGHMAAMTWHRLDAPYLKNHGKSYVAEPIRFQGTGHQVTALAAGQVDVAAVSPGGLVSMVARAGLNAQLIADVLHDSCEEGTFSQPFYIRKDANIGSYADLRGKRIAINSRGSAHDMIVSGALRKGGVEDNEVTRVEMNFAAMVPFLKEGKVDVGGYLPQFVPPVDSDPNIERMFTACDIQGPSSLVTLVSTKEFIAENRDALVDMMADHMGALNWFYDPANRDEMLKIVSEVTNAPAENFSDYVFTRADFVRSRDLYIDPAIVQRSIDAAYEFGVIDTRIEVVPDHADMSIVRDAKARLGGS